MTAADAGGDVLDTGPAVEATQLLDDMRGGPPPHASKLFALQFQVGITGTAVAPFDVAVAYIELYK